MVRICSVSHCKENSKFKFPAKPDVQRKWLTAIRRLSFKPKGKAGLCEKHFKKEDFILEGTESGAALQRKRLRNNAVPSLELHDGTSFETPSKRPKLSENDHSYTNNSLDHSLEHVEILCETPTKTPNLTEDDPLDTGNRSISPETNVLQRQESDLGVEVLQASASFDSAVYVETDIGGEVVVEHSESVSSAPDITSDVCVPSWRDVACGTEAVQYHSVHTQTIAKVAPYTISDFMFKPEHLKDLTGVDYELFTLIFRSLGPAVNRIKYRSGKVMNVSIEDQMFLTLWKLRKATSDIELGIHFGIHQTSVSNIFSSFVTFMANQWGKLNLWPSRELIDFYMPAGFKKQYPSTRVIVDGTEFPIHKPTNPRAQQATFSKYKNTNTLKAMVGATPSGLISYVTECYGGSTSDRQITERSSLPDLCERKDSVMADRGFNVQDIFAPKGVTINMPDFLKGQDHLPGTVIMKDRKLASKRVHIERLIGLTKTYKILQTRLQHSHVSIGSEIFFVCVVLTNFKENIVSSHA